LGKRGGSGGSSDPPPPPPIPVYQHRQHNTIELISTHAHTKEKGDDKKKWETNRSIDDGRNIF
jgi:hypothetical protein